MKGLVAFYRGIFRLTPDIRITYPPDYDGELHIWHESAPMGQSTTFLFSVSRKNEESERDALKRAARDILARL